MRSKYFGLFCLASLLHGVSFSSSLAQQNMGQLAFELSLRDKRLAKPLALTSPDEGLKATSIALGMPIAIRLVLINEGNDGVDLLPSLDPSFSLVHIYLVNATGAEERITVMRWETKDVFLKRRTFRPGERLSYETLLFGRLAKGWIGRKSMKHEYLFDHPGTYQLFARYKSTAPALELESNRVTIEVGPPMQGWNALKEAQIVALIEGEISSNAEHRQRLARIRRILQTLPENPYASWLPEMLDLDKSENIQEAPVAPELQDKVERLFQEFLDTLVSGNVEQCVDFVAEGFRRNSVVWSRARQREEFQEEIDKLQELRSRGVSVNLTAHFLSVALSGKDVIMQAVVSYRDASNTSDDQTVRCRLRKYGKVWLIQELDRISK